MVWGRRAKGFPGEPWSEGPSPPRFAGREPSIPAPIALCMDCETPVFLVGCWLPTGWEEVEDHSVPSGRSARCPACISSREAAGASERPSASSSEPFLPGSTAVPDELPTGRLYAGYRITFWPVGGPHRRCAVLRIHGGAAPRPSGRDQPIHSLATPADLDELIIHLAAIRRSLAEKDQNHV